MNMFDFSSLLHRSNELDPHIAHNNKKLSNPLRILYWKKQRDYPYEIKTPITPRALDNTVLMQS
jgi:hypothetical protein